MDAQQLHHDALVWDAHRDVAYEAPQSERFLQNWLIGTDLHLKRVRQGGIDAQVYAFCISPEPGLPPTAEALRELDTVFQEIDDHSDEVVIALTTEDVLQAKKEGKLAAILSFEGAEPILSELGLLRIFYRLGFRNIGLTWNYRNAVADGGYEGVAGGGLSSFGREVVREMNRLGMMIDIAHLAPAGMRDVLKISERPVIHSHQGVNALAPNATRTLHDEMLEAIAANGGVFCVTTVPQALTDRGEDATINTFLDHVDYAVKVMGIDHVGLGADFDVLQSHLEKPLSPWLKGLEEADKWPLVTAGLCDRGYTESDIRKILGLNLLRVFKEVIG